MTDPVSTARSARENLARGLAALQSPGVPPTVMDVAEPVAEAMSALHRVESTYGAALAEAAPSALHAVRRALSMLQAQPPGIGAVDQAIEAVAGSLSLVHTLNQLLVREPAPPPHGLGSTVALGDHFDSRATQPSAQPAYPYAHAPAAAPLQAAQPPYVGAAAAGFAANAPQAAFAQPVNPAQAAPAMAANVPQAGLSPQAAPTAAYGPPPVQSPYGPAPGQYGQPAQPPYGQPGQGPYAPPPQAGWPGAQQQAAPGGWPGQQQPVQQQAPPWGQQSPQQSPPAAPAAPHYGQPALGSAPHHPAPAMGSAPMHAQPEAPYRAPPDALRVEAELGAHSPTNFYKGLSGNDVIDSGGIFIATYKIPKTGQNLAIKVSLPGGYEFEALGVVAWTRDAPHSTAGGEVPPGYGARFTQISAEGRQLVYRYVRNREPLFHDDL